MKFIALVAAFAGVEALQHRGLPLCDGSNGVVGMDCLSSGDYPRKLNATPYAPNGQIGQAGKYPYW